MRLSDRWTWTAVAAGVVVVVAAVGWWVRTAPGVVLLGDAAGATWVRADRPFDLGQHADPLTFASFATPFTVPAPGSAPGSAPGPAYVLTVTALRRVVVRVDGRRVFDSGSDGSDWRVPRAVPMPPLAAGPHRLQLDVANRNGPSLVRAACGPLRIATGGPTWRATDTPGRPPADGAPAVPAAAPWDPPLARRFASAPAAVGRLWPFLAALVAAGAGGYLFAAARSGAGRRDWAGRVRWAVLAAWTALAVNNVARLPPYVGYDVLDHVAYVRLVAATWWPPLPNQGWETFHPPLYYFCSAALYRAALACGATVDGATLSLRLIPLACGAGMAEVCYRAGRRVFPGRGDLQAVAVVVGGLVPMNLYMGQAVSNEPLAACLGGCVTLACLALMRGPADGPIDSPRRWAGRLAGLGLLLGLAVLTKLSGLVWAGPVAVVVAVAAVRRWPAGGSVRRAARWAGPPAAVLAVAGLVCGWYFARNLWALGVPFLSHSTVGSARWWQDPGYRTPGQYLTFGRALAGPAYSGLTSVWDDVYATLWSDGMLNGILDFDHRPPWHYGLMSCGLWLALAPTAAVAAGAVRAAAGRGPPAGRDGLRFAAAVVGLFALALMYVTLTWPIYSDVKASYLLGVTPCLAVLAAAGFDALPRGLPWRAAAVGLLTGWAATAYLTFFITP